MDWRSRCELPITDGELPRPGRGAAGTVGRAAATRARASSAGHARIAVVRVVHELEAASSSTKAVQ